MTDQTNGNTETITTKSKVDGKTTERSARLLVPTLADINGYDKAVQDFALDCFRLGIVAKLRNFINNQMADKFEVVTLADIMAMVKESAESRADNSVGLAAYRETVYLLCNVAQTVGMSSIGVAKVRKLVSSPVGLSMAAPNIKARIATLLDATSNALDEASLERLAKPLTALVEATQTTEEAADEW